MSRHIGVSRRWEHIIKRAFDTKFIQYRDNVTTHTKSRDSAPIFVLPDACLSGLETTCLTQLSLCKVGQLTVSPQVVHNKTLLIVHFVFPI